MKVIRKDNRFCVEGQDFSIELSDTSANRKVAVVFLRGMRDGQGKPLFTLEELAGEGFNRKSLSLYIKLVIFPCYFQEGVPMNRLLSFSRLPAVALVGPILLTIQHAIPRRPKTTVDRYSSLNDYSEAITVEAYRETRSTIYVQKADLSMY